MKKILVLFILWGIFSPGIIFAMRINEIMYDVGGTDTGREWIEIYNNTSVSVDFSKWKVLENAVNHSVKIISGSSIIPSGGYAIVADNDVNFLVDNPSFSGTLFDSAFSLTNTAGETLSLIDPSGNKIDEITYSETIGAKSDGNSLQLHDGFLIAATPTPGSENNSEPTEKINNTDTSTTTPEISSHSSPKPIVEVKEKPDFELSIGRDRVSSIKTPIIFEPLIDYDFRHKTIKYMWNFGDGNQQKGKKIEHYYKHPGKYNVVLNASYDNNYAVARSTVFISKPNITATTTPDGLEFENLSSEELNIGRWKVKTEDKTVNFSFPQDTIISPKTKITFDKELFIKDIKNIDFSGLKLDIHFPNGDLVK